MTQHFHKVVFSLPVWLQDADRRLAGVLQPSDGPVVP